MRYLLLPFTLVLWFLVSYLSVYYGLFLTTWMFSLDWIWLLIVWTLFSGLFSLVVHGLPGLFQVGVIELYKRNFAIITLHSIVGFMGFLYFYFLIYNFPPALIADNNAVPLLSGMWAKSWLKTLILVPSYVYLHLSLLYFTFAYPIALWRKHNEERISRAER